MKGTISASEFSTHLPLDPGEIEHVLDLLRGDLDPETVRHVKEGSMRAYGVASRLQGALLHRATARIEQLLATGLASVAYWPPTSIKDWASLTTSRDDLMASIATAWCCLYWLEEAGRAGAESSVSTDEMPSSELPDWQRLRSALIEVAHWIISAEYIDQEKWSARAEALEQENARLRPMASHGQSFKPGRRKGALSAANQYILNVLNDHPGSASKEIAAIIDKEAAESASSPFEADAGRLIERATGRAVNDLHSRIDDVRRRHYRQNSGS